MARPNYRQREIVRARLKAMGEPCAICGKPIDYSLDWWVDPKDGKRKRHPLSFEYDHIKPRSLCDADGDTHATWSMDNAQAAHRICNQRKGNRHGGARAEGNPSRVIHGRAIPTSRTW